MMSIIRSMIKTRRCFSRKQKFRERDEKPTNFPLLLLLCLSFYVVDRQPTTKEDRHSFFFFFSLSLSFFRLQTRGRKEVKKTNAKLLLFARSRRVLFSKFVRAQKSVRILFCPVVLSVVFALKDRRLSFRRRRRM